MTGKLPKYNSLVNRRDLLSETASKLKDKLKGEEDNLRLKIEYNTFKMELDEVRKELRQYEKVQKYAKYGNYEKVSQMSLENPELKEVLPSSDLIKLANYYEESIKKMNSNLDNLSIINSKLTRSLERTLNKMEGGEEIR